MKNYLKKNRGNPGLIFGRWVSISNSEIIPAISKGAGYSSVILISLDILKGRCASHTFPLGLFLDNSVHPSEKKF